MDFWSHFAKASRNKNVPILCLAPMADVTDAAFRYIIAKHSKIPHVTYTEFVSADGLALAPKEGRKKLLKTLEFSEIERPIVAQFFGSRPDTMKKAAALAVKLGFDGVDINMGCPDRSVEKQKAGAALIKNPKLARQLIRAAKEGVKNNLPISVKTRLGYNKDELDLPPASWRDGWLSELLAEKPAAIIIHARTRKEMSKVSARWERVKRAMEIKKAAVSKTLIIGNGDVASVSDAVEKCKRSGADGAMIGRAIFGNPWLFSGANQTDISDERRIKVLVEHTKLFEKKFMGRIKSKNFAVMKKHFKSYLSGIKNSKNLKEKLMKAESAKEVEMLAKNFLSLKKQKKSKSK